MRIEYSILLICSTGITGIWPTSIASASQCSSSSIRDCLIAFTRDNFDVFHLDDDVPTWSDNYDRLQGRCQAYRLFSSCVEPLTPTCNSSMQLALKGLDNAYQFLCTNDGIADYLSNQSCYVRADIRDMAKTCNQTYSTKLSTISSSDSAVSLYCRYVDDYIDCLTAGIKSRCGVKAAKWQSDWIRNLRKPEMQLNKCPGWVAEDSSNNVWATALLVALALTTVLMIAGIITLIIFIIRKRMLRERLRRSMGDNDGRGGEGDAAPLPPPYSIVVETPGPDGQLQPHLVDSLSPASQEELASRRNTPGGTSAPFKVPILPPPYYERPEECAPPYYEPNPETSGQANEGFVGEEGGEKSEEIQQVITLESKAEISEA